MSDNDTKMTEPMSKEEMIDILKGLVFGTFDRTTAKEREALDMAIKVLEQTRWIPVSERLPEKEMGCLVTDSLGKVHRVTFYHALDGRESYFSGCYCVSAWMPLPKPYEPQESEVSE